MPEKLVFKPRRREGANRDASLIVIATEGARTERKYFTDLINQEHFKRPNVHVEIVERPPAQSAPEHVIQTLDRFRSKYKLRGSDELWMVIDRDRWQQAMLADVAARCIQKEYRLCVSNPAFELWLLLHVKHMGDYEQEVLDELARNARCTRNRTRLEQELRDILGSYNKSNPDTIRYFPEIESAITQARQLDGNPADRWPRTLGTRVYLLVERIIQR